MTAALDAADIRAALDPALSAQLARIEIAARSVSTQTDALAAPAPAQGCALFLAEHQTGGHGRQGRGWVSAPAGGSLALSLARHFRAPIPAMSGLSLVVGIALAEALAVDAVGLKWPNDLVADGRKLGGILVNLRASPSGGCDAVIGVGLNIDLPVQLAAGIDQDWTDLARLGRAPVSRNALLAQLLARLLPALAQFEAEGMAAFQSRWHRYDALAGRAVRVHDGPRVHEGVFAGIDEYGQLRLRNGADERIFSSGEVSLRPT